MIKPLGDRVVIELVEAEQATAGGIVLPDSEKEKVKEGKEVAVSSGKVVNRVKVEREVKEGDHIIFSKCAGTEVEHDGKQYINFREDDILAVIGLKIET